MQVQIEYRIGHCPTKFTPPTYKPGQPGFYIAQEKRTIYRERCVHPKEGEKKRENAGKEKDWSCRSCTRMFHFLMHGIDGSQYASRRKQNAVNEKKDKEIAAQKRRKRVLVSLDHMAHF